MARRKQSCRICEKMFRCKLCHQKFENLQRMTDLEICGRNAWPVVSGMRDLEMVGNVDCNAVAEMFAWMHHRLCQEMCDMSGQNMQHTGSLEMCWNLI